MPYGLPWGVDAFICPKCREACWRPLPYCPYCGSKQDPRKVFKPRAIRRAVSDMEQVKEVIKQMRGKRVRLWDYCVSHCELQLLVADNKASESARNPVNTLILCAATEHITVPTSGWYADMHLEQFEEKYGSVYRLIDESAGVSICCGLICIYEYMPAKYFDV